MSTPLLSMDTPSKPESGVSENAPPSRPDPTAHWQRVLRPIMIVMVVVLTLFFFAASLYQLNSVLQRIEQSPELDMQATLGELSVDDATSYAAQYSLLQWKTLALLESHSLARRYHQANVSLQVRVWVRYLGFVTGMILALIGAVFILGKLSEAHSKLSAEGAGLKAGLSTASPGLALAVLGTCLMGSTIFVHNPIEIRDDPLYLITAMTPNGGTPAIGESSPEDLSSLSAPLVSPERTQFDADLEAEALERLNGNGTAGVQ